MAHETIILEKRERVALITLNRPAKLNALTGEMVEELIAAIEGIGRDRDARVLILTGAGRAFCAGGDMVEWEPACARMSGDELREYGRHVHKMILGIHRLSIPTLAMVNGVAVGGGLEVAMACDMRIASDNARFIVGYTRVGAMPDMGGTWLLPRIIGVARAAEYLFTSDPIEAEEAERIGLVNRLVPAAELESATMELARRIANGPALALKLDKMHLYKGLELDLETALEFEIACTPIVVASQDYREALAAFSEKREPRFQ